MTDARQATPELPASLALVGAGKMGGAMLAGWLAAGLDPRAVTVVDPHPSDTMRALAERSGVSLNPPGLPAPPEVLVLAIKPQALAAAAPGLLPFLSAGTMIVSILAGQTVSDIARACPGARAIVRAMPNLPAAIGRGATGAYPSPEVSEAQRAVAAGLLGAVGSVEWVEREDEIDAVTAVSGSGPAYLFHLVECLAAAGEAAGLESGLSARLARATIVGAADLLRATGEDPARLRENVTSPGGTTAAALAVLQGEGGLGPLMTEAVLAARRRAAELSG